MLLKIPQNRLVHRAFHLLRHAVAVRIVIFHRRQRIRKFSDPFRCRNTGTGDHAEICLQLSRRHCRVRHPAVFICGVKHAVDVIDHIAETTGDGVPDKFQMQDVFSSPCPMFRIFVRLKNLSVRLKNLSVRIKFHQTQFAFGILRDLAYRHGMHLFFPKYQQRVDIVRPVCLKISHRLFPVIHKDRRPGPCLPALKGSGHGPQFLFCRSVSPYSDRQTAATE